MNLPYLSLTRENAETVDLRQVYRSAPAATVEVTQRCLNAGLIHNETLNPVALALRPAVRPGVAVTVYPESIGLVRYDDGRWAEHAHIDLPPVARALLRAFAEGRKVEPLSFEIPLPPAFRREG
jgi:hypothetical protein